MHTCQTGLARQNPSKRSLEFQLYDFRKFPEIDVDRYGLSTEKFVSGELMKSGKRRPKNAISFKMECEALQDFHECIDHFVMNFIKQEFSPDFVKSLSCAQAFVRFHLPIQRADEPPDFCISAEIMKVLFDRSIYLDFWFLR